ncbi:MAG: tRNA (uridine(34)/cytosine(34)/5-carboxymethylaminomethyluridine(34)-2'-O)-methyltransferase TrmL [Candidatus Melainabacteria bacterium GWF2_37_15]|nr:MAG: tRNA (uridine(34)/cytosine(34)/5-carboxymethylaminomethyluridine(34)-2'-O)-methyltransferase TrmL [Candidatus Melainabacteria bacterium GWF2_37_15]
MNIVLHEPDIPQNTGNIIRLCACTGCTLYLVGKLGFHITDKHMKRAGLDYWQDVEIHKIPTIKELEENFPENNFYYLSTKAQRLYTEVCFKSGDFLVFGSETRGLPEEIVFQNPEKALKIPMSSDKRSLNLANSVSIVVYEALRQNGFSIL